MKSCKRELWILLVIIVVVKALERADVNGGNMKYLITKHVDENRHITLVCRESTLGLHVQWFKDKTLLNSSYRNNMAESKEEPHLTIDAFNLLHILHVTKTEEGIYTCTVNGKKIQKWLIKVVSKTKLLNQEFIRYSIYLGFVLSVTVTCYCAGVCVAWHRKAYFVDPMDIHIKATKYRHFSSDKEKLIK